MIRLRSRIASHAASLCVATIALCLEACGHGPAHVPQAPSEGGDPAALVIDRAEARLATGERLAAEGRKREARESFDQAVDLYLTTPGGASADPRLEEAYRRTLERIHSRELEALAAGGGLSDPQPEPAGIDALVALHLDQAAPSADTRRRTEEAVRQEVTDFPVELNDKVLACVDLYQGRLRDWFTAALSRGTRYLPYIKRTFAAEGLPQDLAYVALVESAFRTGALSRARAKGVWQFMPSTGRRFGLQQDWWVDERADPNRATRAAASYLKELYTLFGDWNLALAGYNAGEGKISRGVNRYGTRDFWALSRTRALRTETKNYVPMIHAAIIVAKTPDKYGIEVAAEPLPETEQVLVRGAYDLRLLAECAETPLDTIRALNPALQRFTTPEGRSFDFSVPTGQGERTRECLANLPQAVVASYRTHRVRRGQTLSSIAHSYRVDAWALAQANGLTPRQRLAAGTELVVPHSSRSKAGATRAAARRQRRAPSAVASSSKRIQHRVQLGDTLFSIAGRYGASVEQLRAWNGLRVGAPIKAGATLTLFAD
jgi:membrane-bound lytic murein transglycosylase D